jgi:NAD(P)H-quinone oxidoreductase subunit 5
MPILAMSSYFLLGRRRVIIATQFGTGLMGIGFIASFIALTYSLEDPISRSNSMLFNANTLSLLLTTLILFISFIIHRFSLRYMHGDKIYRRYFFNLSAITLSTISMALADNLVLFWVSWTASNVFLASLMIHKAQWKAAYNSGVLAFKTHLLGSLFLLTAIFFLYTFTGSFSIQKVVYDNGISSSLTILFSLGLIILTAMTQSAIWPFHRWLLSSLNSPTPVSALMHAGLVNGGGFLIVKFSPLLTTQRDLLTVLFIFGALTALLGTVWKLMQWNIKSMLACSTMAQMGFMMMQCGLGLFSAAITHLCWHGLFKSYLFLNSGSAIHQQQIMNSPHPTVKSLLTSFVGGFIGMYGFALMTGKPILSTQTTTFLLGFVFMTGTQLMLSIIAEERSFKRITLALILVFISGNFYGTSIHVIEMLLPNLMTDDQQQLSILQLSTLVVFFSLWILFSLGIYQKITDKKLWDWFYIKMLNASMPHPKTITANRNTYNY